MSPPRFYKKNHGAKSVLILLVFEPLLTSNCTQLTKSEDFEAQNLSFLHGTELHVLEENLFCFS